MNLDSKIFVAGHRGLVGDAVCRQLRGTGYTNIITMNRAALDLADPTQVKWFFSVYQPEFVFLCAAHVGGILSNASDRVDFLTKNLAIQTNVLMNAAEYGVEKLLFLGSSCVYPKDCPLPIKPEYLLTGPFEPTTEAYGIAKTSGIRLCQYLREERGCNFISAMPCNLYGPGDHFNSERSHVVPGLITRMHQAKKLGCPEFEVWGDGSALRELLFADDLARALVFLMHAYEDAAPINAGSGDEWTIRAIADEVRKVVGYEGCLYFDDTKPTGVHRKLMDNSRLFGLGWRPQVTFPVGLAHTYAAYEQRMSILR